MLASAPTSFPINHSRYTLVSYDAHEISEFESENVDEVLAHVAPGRVNWITVRDVHDEAELTKLLDHFQLDHFVLREILDEAWMQFETEYENFLYLEYTVPTIPPDSDKLTHSKGSFILGRDFLILYEFQLHGLFGRTRRRIIGHQTKAQRYGADYLLYLLLRAAIVEHYQLSFKRLTVMIEALEDRVLASHGEEAVFQDILDVREEIKPWNEPLLEIEDFLEFVKDAESRFIGNEVGKMFSKSLYREAEDLLNYHERLRSWMKEIMDLHDTNVIRSSNRIVQLLTVVSTIFLPITFITSWYGMNFVHMPELQWRWSYPAVILLIFSVAVSLAVFMKRRRWF